MKFCQWKLGLAVLLAIMISGAYGAPGVRAAESIDVWHAWQGPAASVLVDLSRRFQKSSGVIVNLRKFDSPKALLQETLKSGRRPDILLGQHDWAPDLFKNGLVAGYCLPGGCPQCEVPNPPPECGIMKSVFGGTAIPDLKVGTRYCIEGGCPECWGPNPPPWCWLAKQSLAEKFKPDLLQAAFTKFYPKFGDVFRYGTPTWWEIRGKGPAIIVHGGYIISTTKKKAQSLQYLYELGETSTQIELFKRAGLLPANREALHDVLSGVVKSTDPRAGGVTTEGRKIIQNAKAGRFPSLGVR